MIPGTSELRYRPDIDGLRAIAVVAVLLFHVWPKQFSGGFIGVDVFFVISGYLITSIIRREESRDAFSFAGFYLRRVRRLLPALFAVLAAVLVAGWFILLPSDYYATLRASLATTLISANFLFWRMLSEGYFAADAKLNPLLHTWSLGVEEQFYLVYPLLLVAVQRRFPRSVRKVVIACALASFAASVVLIAGHEVAVFFLAPFRAWEFLAGALLALGLLPPPKSRAAAASLTGAGLVAILAPVVLYGPMTQFPGWAALLPVLGAAAAIHGGSLSGNRASRVLSWKPVVYLGAISYSLYLWHWPLVVFSKYWLQIEFGWRSGAVAVAMSIALAVLSYHFVEVPFRRPHGERQGRAGFIPGVSVVACALVLLSGIGMAKDGFQERWSAAANAFDAQRSPSIPFRDCDRREEPCILGEPGVTPTVAFWGDSHMLAWAPAIDSELRRMGRGGYLLVHSACPPTVGVTVRDVPTCASWNQRVENFVRSRGNVAGVVMSANWGRYLSPGSISVLGADGPEGNQRRVLANAIEKTVGALARSDVEVSILGGVPTYEIDVPFGLAMHRGASGATARLVPHADRFSPSLREVARRSGARYVDVAGAMCPSVGCETEREGVSLYRDDSHLSVAGAMLYSGRVRAAILSTPARRSPGQDIEKDAVRQ